MIKTWVKMLLAIPAIAWAGVGLRHALGSFTMHDTRAGAILLASGLVLLLIGLVGCCFKRTRMVAFVSVLILVISGVGETFLRQHRLESGVLQLEAVYREIAAGKPPFPKEITPTSYENPTFLHWYYQRNTERSFAIVYISSSNGWAMEYPDATWRWIGYKPNGYEPNKTVNRSLAAPEPGRKQSE